MFVERNAARVRFMGGAIYTAAATAATRILALRSVLLGQR